MSRGIPKKYIWKAKYKGSKMWNYFTSKERAKRWAGQNGIIRKR